MMKKSIIVLLCLAAMLSATLSGCKEAPEQTVSTSVSDSVTDAVPTEDAIPEQATDYGCYYDLIDTVRDGLQNGFTDEQRDTLDVTPCVYYTSPTFEILGYLIDDIDGDGINELIIGENGPDDWDSIIYDIFTIRDGSMLHTVAGWDRNRYYLCDNGILANEGSGGASLTIHAYFRYNGQVIEDTAETGLIESVIYDGNRDEKHPWFYSNSVVYSENAEPISEERAYEIMESYAYQKLEFTPFISQ